MFCIAVARGQDGDDNIVLAHDDEVIALKFSLWLARFYCSPSAGHVVIVPNPGKSSLLYVYTWILGTWRLWAGDADPPKHWVG